MFVHYDEKQRKQRVILRSLLFLRRQRIARLSGTQRQRERFARLMMQNLLREQIIPPTFHVNITNPALMLFFLVSNLCTTLVPPYTENL